MDWLTLLLLVPLVVIPVVFLSGFAGCADYFHKGPPRPYDLMATAVGTDRIDLSWNWEDNISPPRTPIFRIERKENGQPIDPLTLAAFPGTFQTHPDLRLKPGTTYEYQVFAVVDVSNRRV